MLAAACVPPYDTCFDEPSLVQGPRVLAVRADPPETLWQSGDPAPTVRLRALVGFDGQDVRAAQVAARLCVPPGPCEGEPVLQLSTDSDHVDVALAVPPALIDAALAADPLHGYDGVRVQAELLIDGADFSLRASKLLLFVAAQPNQGLELDGLQIAGTGRTTQVFRDGEFLNTQVPNRAVPASQREGVLELTPLLRPGSIEEYDTLDLSGRPVHLREQVSYEFFATTHLFYGDPLLEDANGGIQRWSDIEGGALADEPDAPLPDGLVRMRALRFQHRGRIWVVARDGRGAEAWLHLDVNVDDKRCCCGPDVGDAVWPNCCGQGPDVSGCPDLIEPLCNPPPKLTKA